MTDSASLPSIEFYSVNQLCNPVHRNDTLNILLLQEPLLSDLKLCIAFKLASTTFTISEEAILEATTEILENIGKKVRAISKLEILTLFYLLFEGLVRSFLSFIFTISYR